MRDIPVPWNESEAVVERGLGSIYDYDYAYLFKISGLSPSPRSNAFGCRVICRIAKN
jgi:hypothetical protein